MRERNGVRIVARHSIGWLGGFWLAVCAGLAVVVAYQLSRSFPLAPTVTAAPPGAPVLDLAARPALPRSPDADALELIAARPLFSASRRPYVAPSAPLEEVEREHGRPALPLELAGTFLTDTDRTALLLVAGGSPAWLRRGQLIEGWRIEAIERDRVQLSKDGQQQVLHLRADIAVPRTTPPPARRQPGRNDAPSGAHPGEPADQNQVTQD
jgi:hypothetical protein